MDLVAFFTIFMIFSVEWSLRPMHCSSLLISWVQTLVKVIKGLQTSLSWFESRSLFFNFCFLGVNFLFSLWLFHFRFFIFITTRGCIVCMTLACASLIFIHIKTISKTSIVLNWSLTHIRTMKNHLHDWSCILEGILKFFALHQDLIEKKNRLRTLCSCAC